MKHLLHKEICLRKQENLIKTTGTCTLYYNIPAPYITEYTTLLVCSLSDRDMSSAFFDSLLLDTQRFFKTKLI